MKSKCYSIVVNYAMLFKIIDYFSFIKLLDSSEHSLLGYKWVERKLWIYLDISSGSILELTNKKHIPSTPRVLTKLTSKSYDSFFISLT